MPGSASAKKPLLALTRGDPSGIGPELALKAWLATHLDPDAPPFAIAAEPEHLAALATELGLKVPVETVEARAAPDVFGHALPVLASPYSVKGRPGAPDEADAAATIASIETCVGLVHSGEAAAVVTNPIAKEVLYRAGFSHPGHTEFLAELALRFFDVTMRPVMLLWSPELAVVPATIHVPLSRVPALLSRALLVETGLVVAEDLKRSLRRGAAAPGLCRPQSPCRRRRRDGQRGKRNHHSGARGARQVRGRRSAGRIRPILCSTPRRGAAMTPRSPCIMTRR